MGDGVGGRGLFLFLSGFLSLLTFHGYFFCGGVPSIVCRAEFKAGRSSKKGVGAQGEKISKSWGRNSVDSSINMVEPRHRKADVSFFDAAVR